MAQPETASNGPQNSPLSPRQEAVALALACGRTLREAAEASGVGERTIKTWLAQQPALSRRVNGLRGELTSRALGRLAEGMALAADTLRELLAAKSEGVRLSAARAVLELGNKLRESVELEQRLTALEADRRD